MKTSKQLERDHLRKINDNKIARKPYIRILCWTNGCQSASETHATSLTDALKKLKRSQEFHANWRLEFISEPAGNPPYIDEIYDELRAASRRA